MVDTVLFLQAITLAVFGVFLEAFVFLKVLFLCNSGNVFPYPRYLQDLEIQYLHPDLFSYGSVVEYQNLPRLIFSRIFTEELIDRIIKLLSHDGLKIQGTYMSYSSAKLFSKGYTINLYQQVEFVQGHPCILPLYFPCA